MAEIFSRLPSLLRHTTLAMSSAPPVADAGIFREMPALNRHGHRLHRRHRSQGPSWFVSLAAAGFSVLCTAGLGALAGKTLMGPVTHLLRARSFPGAPLDTRRARAGALEQTSVRHPASSARRGHGCSYGYGFLGLANTYGRAEGLVTGGIYAYFAKPAKCGVGRGRLRLGAGLCLTARPWPSRWPLPALRFVRAQARSVADRPVWARLALYCREAPRLWTCAASRGLVEALARPSAYFSEK